ncbi:MAG: hypothetical protein LUF82_06555 [Clostridia bacterium]|nr:hypothetical protein [Clostridia bacterium]
MKVYFVSAVEAALKLDGGYVGIIDGFERYCEIDCKSGVLAEVIPDGNLQPLNFFINENFFKNPPPFADIYACGGSRFICFKNFLQKDSSLKMLLQCSFLSMTVTVYRQGGIFVSCEGKDFETYRLPECYAQPRYQEVTAGGNRLLALYGGSWLTLINQNGKIVFMNEVESCSFGDIIEVKAPLHTCADSYAECQFTYSGKGLAAAGSRTVERVPQGKELLPFVFFERVLCCGDYGALLCDDLKPKAGSLKKYLGKFTGVTVPTADFYSAHEDEKAAGLVYSKSGLYEIIYYAIDEENGKITNIRPV